MRDRKIRVLFLCTANSCRSQMAEGLARELGRGIIEPFSAGLFVHYVHPRAAAVMKEIGIDISGQRSKEIDMTILKNMDVIITLCTNADRACPRPPHGVRRIHWPIRDPVGTVGTEGEIMAAFRRARDEIKDRIGRFIEDMNRGPF